MSTTKHQKQTMAEDTLEQALGKEPQRFEQSIKSLEHSPNSVFDLQEKLN
jgi:hypothetical protein